jgi:hypothetical protein
MTDILNKEILDSLLTYLFEDKIRYGVNCDGGYVIANLKDVIYDCYISAGVSCEESFSRDFIKTYNMNKDNSFAFDGTIRDYPYNYTKDITFVKKNINSINDNYNTNLSYLINNYKNIFLKMDIEGGEYPWLLSLDTNSLKNITQIAIEFHGIMDDTFGCDRLNKLKCFKKLAETHYIVHVHGNNWARTIDGIPNVIELTYVNKSYFTMPPKLNTINLPLAYLDCANKNGTPDIRLNMYPFVHENHPIDNFNGEADTLAIPSIDLSKYEKKIFSQNGEDGVTMKLIELLYDKDSTDNKYYVEFSVHTGKECNTRILREEYNWKGLLMDGSNENIDINLRKEFITKENIIDLFKKYNVPSNINLLSVDIDFNDYYVLNEILNNYTCDIIICEYNATHLPAEDKIVIYDKNARWNGTNYFGASLLALDKLSVKFNYSLVYCDNNGVNCYFIKNSILKDKNLQFLNNGDIKKIYRKPTYGRGPNGGHREDNDNRKYVSSHSVTDCKV